MRLARPQPSIPMPTPPAASANRNRRAEKAASTSRLPRAPSGRPAHAFRALAHLDAAHGSPGNDPAERYHDDEREERVRKARSRTEAERRLHRIHQDR